MLKITKSRAKIPPKPNVRVNLMALLSILAGCRCSIKFSIDEGSLFPAFLCVIPEDVKFLMFHKESQNALILKMLFVLISANGVLRSVVLIPLSRKYRWIIYMMEKNDVESYNDIALNLSLVFRIQTHLYSKDTLADKVM